MDSNDYPLHDWIMDGAGWFHSDVCRKCALDENVGDIKNDNRRMLPADVYAAQVAKTARINAALKRLEELTGWNGQGTPAFPPSPYDHDNGDCDPQTCTDCHFVAWEIEIPNGQFYVWEG